MFINFSNHNSSNWSKEQIDAARKFGDIVDVSFPSVPANADSKDVMDLANSNVEKILKLNPDCVMCQGEFTLTYAIVNMLKEKGIKVVAGCSDRDVVERIDENGLYEKKAIYRFVQFRDY